MTVSELNSLCGRRVQENFRMRSRSSLGSTKEILQAFVCPSVRTRKTRSSQASLEKLNENFVQVDSETKSVPGSKTTSSPEIRTRQERKSKRRASEDVLLEQDFNSPERTKRQRTETISTLQTRSQAVCPRHGTERSHITQVTKTKRISSSKSVSLLAKAAPNFDNIPEIVGFEKLEQLVDKCKKENIRLNNLDDIVYEVEKVRDHRKRAKEFEFLIRWKDWSAKWDSWVTSDSITTAMNLQIVEYFDSKKMLNEAREFLSNFIREYLLHDEAIDFLLLSKLANTPLEVERDRVMKPNLTECREMQRIVRRLLDQKDYKTLLRPFDGRLSSLIDFSRARLSALDDNERWSGIIASIEKNADIDIENNADLEKIPSYFQYVTDYVVSPKVRIQEPSKSCRCKSEDCFDEDCCGVYKSRSEQTRRVYTPSGQLTPSCTSLPLFECNSFCDCGPNCKNRVIQRGVTLAMTIFKTTTRGWGVRTTNKIAKGTFIAEYLGELMTSKEAVARHNINFAYLFDLKPYRDQPVENTVDAAVCGNISRFFNHSCDPNMAISYAYIENHNPAAPRLAFFARRNIAREEELTFNYCMQPTKGEGTLKRVLCMCGADKCRKYLF